MVIAVYCYMSLSHDKHGYSCLLLHVCLRIHTLIAVYCYMSLSHDKHGYSCLLLHVSVSGYTRL